jgi:acetyl-CoA acetyltransferase
MENVVVGGVGIHPFGRFEAGYRDTGAIAAQGALDDAGIELADIGLVLVANVGAEMAKGHGIVERLGRPGIPIINVEAACASSASALLLGAKLIESGSEKAVLCAGVEKAARGFIPAAGFEDWQTENGLGISPLYFALQAQALLNATDATIDDLADVSVKNHRHAVHNPNAMYRREVSREEVLSSKPVCSPLTLLMLCAPNEGAAAAVLLSADEARRRCLRQPVRLRSVQVVSRSANDWFVPGASFQTSSVTSLTRRAAANAFNDCGIAPNDVNVVECQDTDVASELLAYSELGLCAAGEEAALLRSGATTIGGRIPVNPSGGLLSKGEPLGASGLGQLHELTQQIRGRCGQRQVLGARVGMSHVMGAGHNAGVVLVSV